VAGISINQISATIKVGARLLGQVLWLDHFERKLSALFGGLCER
jgi:hypothetical protein